MEYKLTYRHLNTHKTNNGTNKRYSVYRINGIIVLRHITPKVSMRDVYYSNGYIYQIRYNGCDDTKERTVKYPVSKNILDKINIPHNICIYGKYGIYLKDFSLHSCNSE